MRQYARFKEDGYTMGRNHHMDPAKWDFFESEEAPPEFLADLPAFLAGKVDESVAAKPKKPKPDPVFLKNADGTELARL